MTKTSNIITQKMSLLEKNLLNLGTIPGATVHELKISARKVGSNMIPQVDFENRNVGYFTELNLRESCSAFSNAQIQSEYLSKFKDYFDSNDSSRDIKEIMKSFLNHASEIYSQVMNNSSVNGTFISIAEDMKNALIGLIDHGNALIYQADQQINSEIIQVNNILKDLLEINREAFLLSKNNAGFIDEQEEKLRKLAELMNINVSYTRENSGISIFTENGTVLLLGDTYATFLKDEQGNWRINYTGNKKLIDISVKDTFSSGKIGALFDVKENLLPKQINLVKSLAKDICSEVNKVHNRGSGFPGKNSYKSNIIIDTEHINSLDGGKTIIAVLDENGMPVKTSDSVDLKPLVLDFSKIYSTFGRGNLSLKDIANEINQYFNVRTSRIRGVMGRIDENVPLNVGTYLLNDIKIIGNSDIVNKKFNFNLELENNSDFDAKLDILSVYVNDKKLEINLPENINLLHGEYFKTDSNFIIDLEDGLNSIDFKLSVNSISGVYETKWVRFIVNSNDKNQINVRSLISQPSNNLPEHMKDVGYINTKSNLDHFARVEFVDEYDNVVSKTDKCYFSIKAIDSNHKIIVQDDSEKNGLGYFLGLNNFFKNDMLEVNQEIKNDPDKNLSLAKLSLVNESLKKYLVGEKNASINLTFSGNIQVKDSLSILLPGYKDVIKFEFTNNAISETDIGIADNLDEQIENIIAVLNKKNKATRNFFDLDKSGNTLAIKCKLPGIIGNEVKIGWNLINAKINNRDIKEEQLLGGTEKVELKLYQPKFYKITIGSKEVMLDMFHLSNPSDKKSSIYDNCSSVVHKILDMNSIYEKRLNCQKEIFDNLQLMWKNESGITKEQSLIDASYLMRLNEALFGVIKARMKLNDTIIRVLLG